jgi:hypothetical protein
MLEAATGHNWAASSGTLSPHLNIFRSFIKDVQQFANVHYHY